MAARGNEEFKGYISSVLFGDGTEIPCKLKKWSPGDIKNCINCGVIPWLLYNLQCSHKLCEKCYIRIGPYICDVDKTETNKYEGSLLTTANRGLLDTIVECPLCGSLEKYQDMQEHVKTRHPEILEKEMHPSSPDNKHVISQAPKRPPPGFEKHVPTPGMGRGLLHYADSVGQTGVKECEHQQAIIGSEFAASDAQREDDMETEETPPSWPHSVGKEHRQELGDASSNLPCENREYPANVFERKEHMAMCPDFLEWWEGVILYEISNKYVPNEKKTSPEVLGHAYNCGLLKMDLKKSFVELMNIYYEEHRKDQCLPSSSIKEHVEICGTCRFKGRNLVELVVRFYFEKHMCNQCPETKKMDTNPEGTVEPNFQAPTSTPATEAQQEAEEITCPTCNTALKIEEVEDHTEKCSRRVADQDYGNNMAGQCGENEEICTSSQVGEDIEPQTATEPAGHEPPHQVISTGEGSKECPCCQTFWDTKDLPEHVENCLGHRTKALYLSSESFDNSSQQHGVVLVPESNSDDTSVKKADKNTEKTKPEGVDIEILKDRVQNMEDRLNNIEEPLLALIGRLQKNE